MSSPTKGKRTFEVVESSTGKIGGRYISSVPSGSAKKAGSKIAEKEGATKLRLTIREITRGSKNKTFTYDWERIEQNEEVIINGKPVVYKYKVKVHAVK